MNAFELHNEAETALNEIDKELQTVKMVAAKTKHYLSQAAVLSIAAVPFSVGYLLFKRSHKPTKNLSTHQASYKQQLPSLVKHIPLAKTLLPLASSWLPGIAGESLLLGASYLAKKFLTK